MAQILQIIRRYRDAITGKFVSRAYAEKHPRTTVGERVQSYMEKPEDRDNGSPPLAR